MKKFTSIKQLRAILGVGVTCSMLIACTGGTSDLQQKFEEVRARPGRAIEKIPEYKPMPKFSYPSHLRRRNPFYAYKKQLAARKRKSKNHKDENAPNLKRKKQFLEKYKLGDLKMVGTLGEGSLVWGLVLGPDENIHKVMIGNYIGQDYGRVVSINNKEIRILERYKVESKWKKREVYLAIDKNKKEMVNPKELEVETIVR